MNSYVCIITYGSTQFDEKKSYKLELSKYFISFKKKEKKDNKNTLVLVILSNGI